MLTERQQIIVALIAGQDVRKWDVRALFDWAATMADAILQDKQ